MVLEDVVLAVIVAVVVSSEVDDALSMAEEEDASGTAAVEVTRGFLVTGRVARGSLKDAARFDMLVGVVIRVSQRDEGEEGEQKRVEMILERVLISCTPLRTLKP